MDHSFNLEPKDRYEIVRLLRAFYDKVSRGKSYNYLDESQKKECTTIGNMVSKLGYNAFTEGMDF